MQTPSRRTPGLPCYAVSDAVTHTIVDINGHNRRVRLDPRRAGTPGLVNLLRGSHHFARFQTSCRRTFICWFWPESRRPSYRATLAAQIRCRSEFRPSQPHLNFPRNQSVGCDGRNSWSDNDLRKARGRPIRWPSGLRPKPQHEFLRQDV